MSSVGHGDTSSAEFGVLGRSDEQRSSSFRRRMRLAVIVGVALALGLGILLAASYQPVGMGDAAFYRGSEVRDGQRVFVYRPLETFHFGMFLENNGRFAVDVRVLEPSLDTSILETSTVEVAVAQSFARTDGVSWEPQRGWSRLEPGKLLPVKVAGVFRDCVPDEMQKPARQVLAETDHLRIETRFMGLSSTTQVELLAPIRVVDSEACSGGVDG